MQKDVFHFSVLETQLCSPNLGFFFHVLYFGASSLFSDGTVFLPQSINILK